MQIYVFMQFFTYRKLSAAGIFVIGCSSPILCSRIRATSLGPVRHAHLNDVAVNRFRHLGDSALLADSVDQHNGGHVMYLPAMFHLPLESRHLVERNFRIARTDKTDVKPGAHTGLVKKRRVTFPFPAP